MIVYRILLYVAVSTPFKIAFIDDDHNTILYYIDMIIDILFFTDLISSFFVAYFDPHQELVIDRKV
jgi:hypothetical protein